MTGERLRASAGPPGEIGGSREMGSARRAAGDRLGAIQRLCAPVLDEKEAISRNFLLDRVAPDGADSRR